MKHIITVLAFAMLFAVTLYPAHSRELVGVHAGSDHHGAGIGAHVGPIGGHVGVGHERHYGGYGRHYGGYGRHFYRGHWYDYGVGPCWLPALDGGWVWDPACID